jgi:uncharacterized protein (DUF736 family)
VQRAAETFFPWSSTIPREARKPRPPVLRSRFGLPLHDRIGPHLLIAIEAAMGAAFLKEVLMATIGKFRKTGDGFEGMILTFVLRCADVRLVPNKGDQSDKAPDFQILAEGAEIGAAWKKVGQNDRPYLSCKIDDPSFTAPVYARLVERGEGQYDLLWAR